MAIEKLNISFVDGATVIGAANLNPIVNKINEIIDAGVQPATSKILIAGESSNLSHGHVSVHGIHAEDNGADTYLADIGEYVVLHAISHDGYQFSSWDDGFTLPTRTILIDPEKQDGVTYQAQFIGSRVDIDVTCDSSKGVVSGGGNIEIGDDVTIIATPNQYYHFVRWEKNGVQVSTSASYTFKAGNADATYTAVFAANEIGDIEFQTEKVENGIKITSASAENANEIYIKVNDGSYVVFEPNTIISSTSTISFKASNSITNVPDVETGGITVTYDADEDTVTVKAAAVMYYNTTGNPTEESTSVTSNTDLTLEAGNTYYILSAGRNYEVEVIDDSLNS